jgi:hypothetical protein
VSLERDVRARFVALAAGVAGVAAVLDHEPAELPSALGDGAVVTLLGLPPTQQDTATGLATITYSWRVNVYVNLIQGYDAAQYALADLLAPLLALTRTDWNANGLLDEWALSGSGQEPQFAHAEGWLFQPLILRGSIETT